MALDDITNTVYGELGELLRSFTSGTSAPRDIMDFLEVGTQGGKTRLQIEITGPAIVPQNMGVGLAWLYLEVSVGCPWCTTNTLKQLTRYSI